MKFTKDTDIPHFAEIDPLMKSLGFKTVELSVSKHKGSVQGRLVIASDAGVGVQECSKAHRLAQPRLELLLGVQDLQFEVASPGIGRTLKDAREFSLFEGSGVKLILDGTSDWISGMIESADGESLAFKAGELTRRIPYGLIAKAKLEYAREDR
jgi:ribosome maturation factor RimP